MDDNITTLEFANSMWDEASVFSDQQQQQWAQNEALVDSRHLTARKPGRSSIFVPKIPTYIKRKTADFMAQFIGDDTVTIKPTLTASRIGAKIRQKVHQSYIDDMDYESIIFNAAYCGLTYNYAPAYLDWVEVIEREKQKQQTGMPDGSIVEEQVEIETVVESYPVISMIPPEDARIDPSVSWDDIDDARYIGFRIFKPASYAAEMHDKGLWPKIDDDVAPNTPSSVISNVLENERRAAVSPFQKGNSMEIDNNLLEIRYHFYFDEMDDGSYQPVRTVTLGDLQTLEDPEPLKINWGGDKHAWPFVLGQVTPKPFEQFASAIPEQGRDLQIEVNAIRNQRRDNVALILNPEKYVTAHAGVTPAQLSFSYPGKIVSVDNLNAIQWQTVPDVTATGHNEESRVTSDMDSYFSEGPMRQGQPGVRKESATAIQAMSQNSSANSGLDATMFMVSFVRPLHEKLGYAIEQKAPAFLYALAARELGVVENIDPHVEAIRGKFKYNVFANAGQAEIANALSNTANIVGIIAQSYGKNANYKPMFDKLLETAGYDPDSIIPNPMQTGMPNLAATDMGGVDPQQGQNIQPRAAFQGGGSGMAEGGGGRPQ